MAIPLYTTDQFTFCKDSKAWVAEMSDLGNFPLAPVFKDKLGFTLYNPQTRNKTTWAMHKKKFDDEGDLISYVFLPMHESVMQFPKLNGFQVEVFND